MKFLRFVLYIFILLQLVVLVGCTNEEVEKNQNINTEDLINIPSIPTVPEAEVKFIFQEDGKNLLADVDKDGIEESIKYRQNVEETKDTVTIFIDGKEYLKEEFKKCEEFFGLIKFTDCDWYTFYVVEELENQKYLTHFYQYINDELVKIGSVEGSIINGSATIFSNRNVLTVNENMTSDRIEEMEHYNLEEGALIKIVPKIVD